jgi:hypothetical protein
VGPRSGRSDWNRSATDRSAESSDRALLSPRPATSSTVGCPPGAGSVLGLQRQLGNRAVSDLLTASDPRRSAGRAPIRVQRAVGIELEVQSTHLWTGPEDPAANTAPRTKLDYGTPVLSSELGYNVESDDGRFEVVTKPFPETQAGRQGLLDAVDHAARLMWAAQELGREARKDQRSMGSATLGTLSNLEGLTARYAGPGNPWVGYFPAPGVFPDDDDALLAKPQVSVGIPLDRIGALAAQMRSTATVPGQKGSGFTTGVLTSEGGRDEGRGVETSWAAGFEKVNSKQSLNIFGTPATRNFAALVIRYLQEANDPDWISYPKARHAVMARTNFATMFAGVQGGWPAVTPSGTWAGWLAAQAGRTPTEFVYPGGYFADSIPKERFEQIHQIEIGNQIADLPDPPTGRVLDDSRPDNFTTYPMLWNAVKEYFRQGPVIDEWVASISPVLAGAIRPSPDVAPHLPDTPADRGLGAWSRQDRTLARSDRTAGLDPTDAPIFELRLFEGPFGPETWTAFAAHVFDLTRWINSQRGPGSK